MANVGGSGGPKKRRWPGWATPLVVVVVVLAALILLLGPDSGGQVFHYRLF